ncbi:mitochondrial import inner membrane translocase subunit tim-10 [Gaeumannomyces tritici R3-111a-1]|uniref:Mitochondrial import inner membrane translocase subunit n=1 Tax=Gaeumannomyces tritici (strain R3-111a-1) TaxID=644352 RepID=J3NRU3_GAET3|nr:mitochondrial import inner membrane translocase subunit tim-10 [Gaeumannomyces tritici R3-111a-1]EJT78899.1 mitochondrial import inner membrane translocase subunit tim-10 [Gaeumannomyces tritici R3-111a-1]
MFGLGRPQPTSAEKIAAVEAEMKLIAEMHNRLNRACAKKCIPTDYHEGELNKGESVCLDRCAAKFFDVHFKVSDILQKQSQAGGAPGFGGFGN